MLHQFGFPHVFIGWIGACISDPKFSVIINGSPVGYFGGNRGLRQGDPLSPLLFVIVMEAFTFLMDRGIAGKEIDIPRSVRMGDCSHLIFADDILLFCKANRRTVMGVLKLLDQFSQVSGLHINKDKSLAMFSKATRDVHCLLNTLQFRQPPPYIKYLGLPLSVVYPKTYQFRGLVDKCQSRMEGWCCKNLSLAGKVELVHTVIHGMIAYWSQTYKFPNKVIGDLERVCAKFVCGDGLRTWSWASICKPNAEGGLGIRRIRDVNNAAGVKLLWRCLQGDGLWAKFMMAKYVKS